jgi:hypothetical protein
MLPPDNPGPRRLLYRRGLSIGFGKPRLDNRVEPLEGHGLLLSFRATLINVTLTIVALLFFSFFYEKLRKNHIKGALIYSRLNKSVLP